MYILGYKTNDAESGDEYLYPIIGYSKDKAKLEQFVDREVAQSVVRHIKAAENKKEKAQEIRKYIEDNYDKLLLRKNTYAVLRGDDKDNIIHFLVANPGFVREIRGNNDCPLYTPNCFADITNKNNYLIEEIQEIQ